MVFEREHKLASLLRCVNYPEGLRICSIWNAEMVEWSKTPVRHLLARLHLTRAAFKRSLLASEARGLARGVGSNPTLGTSLLLPARAPVSLAGLARCTVRISPSLQRLRLAARSSRRCCMPSLRLLSLRMRLSVCPAVRRDSGSRAP